MADATGEKEVLQDEVIALKDKIKALEQSTEAAAKSGTITESAAKKGIAAYEKQINVLKRLQNLASTSDIGKYFADIDVGSTFMAGIKSMEQSMLTGIAAVRKNSVSLGAALESGVALGSAALREKLIRDLGDQTGFNALQKNLMDAEKQAIQMGISFGQGWVTADADTDKFIDSLSKTISITKETSETVLDVRVALKHAFGPDAITPLKGMQGAFRGVGSSIDITTAALLISKATGTAHTEVTRAMNEAHLDLGMSIDETAEAFGHISDAAKNSGLEFGKVMDTVMQSAKTLKFYGATVETITPLFKRFNESMKGVGKEGLTPKLLEDFVGGLKGMAFGTRALLSMAAPPGQAGQGVLGGGLAMEAALETGEGMGMVTQSLTDTLKKFSGQDIITREEAIADPQLERAYIVQRQMLQKMTGIADPAQQNETMRALQNIDKNGLNAAQDAQSTLEDLLSAGKKTAEAAATDLMKAQLDVQTQSLDAGRKILDVLNNRLRGSPFQKMLQTMDRGFQEMAQSGRGGGDVLKGAVDQLKQQAQDKIDVYGRVGSGTTKKAAAGAAKQAGILSGRATRLETASPLKFQENLGNILRRKIEEAQTDKGKKRYGAMGEQFMRTGTISGGKEAMDIKSEAIKSTLAPMKQQRAELDRAINELKREKGATKDRGKDTTKLDLEIVKLSEEYGFLGKAIKSTRGKLNRWQDTLTEAERSTKKGSAVRDVARTIQKERQDVRGRMLQSPHRATTTRDISAQARAEKESGYRMVATLVGTEKQERSARELAPAQTAKSPFDGVQRPVPIADGGPSDRAVAASPSPNQELTIRVKIDVDQDGRLITREDFVKEVQVVGNDLQIAVTEGIGASIKEQN